MKIRDIRAGRTTEHIARKIPLFQVDGKDVFYGDKLFHRDYADPLTAEFLPDGDKVTMRTTNGAVPTVTVVCLMWERHPDDLLYAEFLRWFQQVNLKEDPMRPTDRDFKMWQLGRKSVHAAA